MIHQRASLTAIVTAMFVTITVLILLLVNRPQVANGSVNLFNDYQSTSTPINNGTFQVMSVPGAIGSVIITGTSTGSLSIYDATTSSVLLRAATMSTSSITIGSIPIALTTSNFPFDTRLLNGLLIVTTGNAPTSTITYRQYQ